MGSNRLYLPFQHKSHSLCFLRGLDKACCPREWRSLCLHTTYTQHALSSCKNCMKLALVAACERSTGIRRLLSIENLRISFNFLIKKVHRHNSSILFVQNKKETLFPLKLKLDSNPKLYRHCHQTDTGRLEWYIASLWTHTLLSKDGSTHNKS